MNMGVTLAVYAAICRETGRAVRLPRLARSSGRRSPTSPTPRLLADHLALGGDDARGGEPGLQHRQRRRLPLAADVAAAGRRARASSRCRSTGSPRRSSSRWPTPAEVWPGIVRRHGLRDLPRRQRSPRGGTPTPTSGRTIETFTDMGRSRRLGFLGVRDSQSSFTDLFDAPAGREDRAMTPDAERRAGRRSRQLQALRFHAATDLRIEEVAEPPAPSAGDVVVRVVTCGICGTDLHEYVAGPIVTPVEPHPLTGAAAAWRPSSPPACGRARTSPR